MELKSFYSNSPWITLSGRAHSARNAAPTKIYFGEFGGRTFWGAGIARNVLTAVAWGVEHALELSEQADSPPPTIWLRCRNEFERYLVAYTSGWSNLPLNARNEAPEELEVWRRLRANYERDRFFIDGWNKGNGGFLSKEFLHLSRAMRSMPAVDLKAEKPTQVGRLARVKGSAVGWPSWANYSAAGPPTA